MAQAILVAIIAGLAAALLSGTLTPGAAPMVLFVMLAPLPLMIAGFGWHPLVTALGGLIAALIVDLTVSERSAIAFAGSIGIPTFGVSALARRAFLNSDESTSAEEGLDLGRIGLALGLYVALMVVLSAIIVEPDHAAFIARIRALSLDVASAMLSPEARSAGAAAKIADIMAPLMLPMTGLVIATTLVFSGALALQIVHRAGRLGFTRPDLRRFRLPGGALILYGLTLIVATRDGYLGAFGEAMALLITFLFMLQGLAVLHVRTLGFDARKLLLGLAWAALIILGLPAIIFLGLGIADHLLNLRRGRP